MKKETYHCDRCKRQLEAEENLQPVKIEVGRYSNKIYKNFDLCINCLEKLGFVKRVIKKDEIVAETIPTTAERLYDIIVEVVQQEGFTQEY